LGLKIDKLFAVRKPKPVTGVFGVANGRNEVISGF
jgi:hypothetical protein